MQKRLTSIDSSLLSSIVDIKRLRKGAYNIRKDGKGIERKVTNNINIVPKEDKPGIDIFIKDGTKGESLHIPVILTESGMNDLVYNDFYVGKDCDVVIVAGCGIHNDHEKLSKHDGIHTFYIGENSRVKYIEKHYGEGEGTGKRVLNPVTNVFLKSGSSMEMDSVQIKGVDSTIRETNATLEDDTNFVVSEKILTSGTQEAKTVFEVNLNGENSSTHVVSRSVAEGSSKQKFVSKMYGNNKCFAHSECDAIVKDNASVTATPEITASSVEASLIHEAAIGKIAGEQLIKLMSLGLSQKQAEEEIINGFLS